MNDIIANDAETVSNTLRSLDLSDSVIVLTGASGLIGTHIISVLGHLERERRGPKAIFAISKNNFPIFTNPLPMCLTSLQLDLTNRSQKPVLPSSDFVIHAAGYGQPKKFLSDPLLTIDLNTRVTAELIELLEPTGRFLFLSTSEIYSGLSGAPFMESQVGTANTIHPRAPYIEGKRCGEAICNAALGSSERCVIARVALAYGPGVFFNDDRVLYSFIRQAIQKRHIRVADSGLAMRTYCYVSDTVEMLLSALFNANVSGIFNVGGQSRTSIHALANLVAELSNASVEFGTEEGPIVGAPTEVNLNMSKVGETLGKWQFVPLIDGVSRTINWWKHMVTG